MESREKRENLRILTNVHVNGIATKVEFMFDKPMEGDSVSKQDGKQFHWHCFTLKSLVNDSSGNKEGVEYVLFKGDTVLTKEMKEFHRGDQVEITKQEEFSQKYNKMITFYKVSKVGENSVTAKVEPTVSNLDPDDLGF